MEVCESHNGAETIPGEEVSTRIALAILSVRGRRGLGPFWSKMLRLFFTSRSVLRMMRRKERGSTS